LKTAIQKTLITTRAVQSGNLAYAEGTYTGKVPRRRLMEVEQQMHGSWVVSMENVDGKWLIVPIPASREVVPQPKAAGAKKVK
jgi:hypothetical protein